MSESINRQAKTKTGGRYILTSEKKREYLKTYYREHREEILEKRRAHYQNNREAILKHQRAHYWENREKILREVFEKHGGGDKRC